MALVGESGSGKTTLAKAMMGLLPGNAEIFGSVALGKTELIGLDEKSLNKIRWVRVAMVFQNGAINLNPLHHIIDQVAEPLIRHGRGNKIEARHRSEKILKQMGLRPEHSLRFPHELSGGEIQRVLLAMALIMDPEILILDEPTSALDPATKAFVAHVIRGVRNQGVSVLLITHDLDLVEKLADDLAVLYLGQIMEIMPARDLFLHPLHPYTWALGRSYPGMASLRDLGGIRGDAFYRIRHEHLQAADTAGPHTHVVGPGLFHEDHHPPPVGCLFQRRCTQAVKDCLLKDVQMINVGGHQVRCLRGGIANRIELEDVSKRYGKLTALYPTRLALHAGEVFCLVGETGSGKSTLAMIAAGVLPADQGRRFFDGRNMHECKRRSCQASVERIGVIYQNPLEAVSHRLTAFDIVAEPLRIQGVGKDLEQVRKRVKQALTDVRLPTEPAFFKRHPHELNMGAVQRLCIARALISEPLLLVADEPTSCLDPSVQAKVLKLLLNLQIEKGLTMLFVTHDIGVARKIGDRVGVMTAGTMVEIGPSARVLGSPLHPYTKFLIQSAGRETEGFSAGIPAPHTAGCPFAPRCNRAGAPCFSELPPLINLDGGCHMVRCFNP